MSTVQAAPLSEDDTRKFWNEFSDSWSSTEQITLPTSHTLLSCLLRNTGENEVRKKHFYNKNLLLPLENFRNWLWLWRSS